MRSEYHLLGCCGLFCGTDCEVYKAAYSKDIEVKKRMTKVLEQELRIKLDLSSLLCESCQGPEENMWFECRICLIRRCGKSHGVRICTECQHYPCPVMKLWLSESHYSPTNIREIGELGLDQWKEKKLKDVEYNTGMSSDTHNPEGHKVMPSADQFVKMNRKLTILKRLFQKT